MKYSQEERNFIRQYLGEWGFRIPDYIHPIVLSYAIDRLKHTVRLAYYKPLIKFLNRGLRALYAGIRLRKLNN